MKRAYYFWIAAILALLFGLLMLFAPVQAAGAFGLPASSATNTTFRVLGSVMLGIALVNFLVRNHAMGETLRAVLWGNLAIHGIGFVADCSSRVTRRTYSSASVGRNEAARQYSCWSPRASRPLCSRRWRR